jgi:hypothetical protein
MARYREISIDYLLKNYKKVFNRAVVSRGKKHVLGSSIELRDVLDTYRDLVLSVKGIKKPVGGLNEITLRYVLDTFSIVEQLSNIPSGPLYGPWYDAILANNGIIENPVYIQSQYVKYSHATFINIAGCYTQGTINVAESGVWMSQKPIGTDFLLTRNTISNTRATDFKFRNLNFNTPSVTNIPTPTVLLEPQSKNISLTNAFGENGGILGASNSLTSTDNDWFGGGFKRVLIANNGLSTLKKGQSNFMLLEFLVLILMFGLI